MILCINGSNAWPESNADELIDAVRYFIYRQELYCDPVDAIYLSDVPTGVDEILWHKFLPDCKIPAVRCVADWGDGSHRYREAGSIRNRHMIEMCDCLLSFPLVMNDGSASCSMIASKKGKKVYVYRKGKIELK